LLLQDIIVEMQTFNN